jgi:DedD protein
VNTRYRDEIEDEQAPGEREISLNAATILGIFFLLALICAIFFGFGYTLGRKSAPSPTAETLAGPTSTVVVTPTPSNKPAPGSRTADLSSAISSAATQTAPTIIDSADNQRPQPTQIAQPAEPSYQTSAQQQVIIPTQKSDSAAPHRTAAIPVAAPAARPTAAPPAAVFMVQIAAVSHQEDAEVLRTALERRSYNINIVRVPQDKLLHVQIGPFNNRKDAEAMRQRLLNDGYNAIVK